MLCSHMTMLFQKNRGRDGGASTCGHHVFAGTVSSFLRRSCRGGHTCSTLGALVRRSKVKAGVAEHAEVCSGARLVSKLGLLERDERTSQRSPERVRLGRGRATVSGLEGESSEDWYQLCATRGPQLRVEDPRSEMDSCRIYSQCSAASRYTSMLRQATPRLAIARVNVGLISRARR